jgi:hypothetical protein
MRFVLAFSCFFRLLFGQKLHPDAAAYLPESAKALPEPVKVEPPKVEPKPQPKVEPKPEPRPVDTKKVGEHHKDGALALLALLQREGRLVDFLREGLDGHDDAAIGAAARDVHRGCKKALDDHFTFEPMMPGAEEDRVTVPKGFDPAEIRLVGEARGEPPFKGTLRHHGWRATGAKLPGLAEGVDRSVIAPAEVEL